ncbi:LemA family protein [Bauldia sp.]|uniref:LemA family protein n=1 Tax=Bauldia sp. TaxID=2575872 RepID=UPI003BA9C56D
MEVWIVLGVIALIAIYLIVLYNRLVALRQTVSQAWSDISVQLKQRHDLVPNLVETVKGYAGHERATLEAVTEARNAAVAAADPQAQAKAENILTGALRQLFALAEAYPDLKANENFLHLQAELSDIENKIAASRRFFNNAVQEYNTAIEQFPAVLIARQFGFTASDFFELDESEAVAVATPPDVKF